MTGSIHKVTDGSCAYCASEREILRAHVPAQDEPTWLGAPVAASPEQFSGEVDFEHQVAKSRDVVIRQAGKKGHCILAPIFHDGAYKVVIAVQRLKSGGRLQFVAEHIVITTSNPRELDALTRAWIKPLLSRCSN